ncbi:hypothetical protein QF028_003473 [Neobacillus sp. B4I6]|uniref:hypothetical protein n=1 Tax=Neobacillus sp. B4I6 TaxID=3373925 RepID=UPI003D1ED371
MKKDEEIIALIDQGRRAYYRQYRQKPENKAKARQYQDNFFLKVGLEQLNSKDVKASNSHWERKAHE